MRPPPEWPSPVPNREGPLTLRATKAGSSVATPGCAAACSCTARASMACATGPPGVAVHPHCYLPSSAPQADVALAAVAPCQACRMHGVAWTQLCPEACEAAW